jgi:hypothetical protein
MIEYAKTILPRVSFSKSLFRKELLKCIGWMKPDELNELKRWCHGMFQNLYPDILDEAFANIAA